jgi:hypothetical protein
MPLAAARTADARTRAVCVAEKNDHLGQAALVGQATLVRRIDRTRSACTAR